jgi:hypothetical protein
MLENLMDEIKAAYLHLETVNRAYQSKYAYILRFRSGCNIWYHIRVAMNSFAENASK